MNLKFVLPGIFMAFFAFAAVCFCRLIHAFSVLEIHSPLAWDSEPYYDLESARSKMEEG